ncbi:glycosyltransferase family 4 protein [Methylobacterium sp. J-090]|uniref:glycosyltransferase family 4 protein n=1 Tax=Methylobacterium sp. J-090 TaxID=2836666 RepID=UPI001FBAC493|nr:glycosyltransferase family 4 protein [Methylobacterium sp. J-090]MCJ2084077.1 glycosyltransferase family 4 protein [Methylobacterium sp. J-090]
MKILLPTLYDTSGGSTRVLLAAAEALAPVHAVTVRAPLAEADEPVPALFPSRPLTSLGRKLAVLPRLVRLLARETVALRRLRPDLIHVHDEPSLYVYGLAARALRPRPFVLWHLHADAGAGRIARLRVALADACILISPHVTPPRGLPATLIPNPLPALAPLPVPDGDPLGADPLAAMAVVGAVVPRKGQDLAVAALALVRARHPTAHLTLVGPELDPAYAAALRARIAALGLDDAVRFAGARPAATVFSGIALAVCPSRAEAQPLALAEALARGLRIAATDIPAHRAMLEAIDADPATLAAPTPAALASAILSAARTPPIPGLATRTRHIHDPNRFTAALRASIDTLARPPP